MVALIKTIKIPGEQLCLIMIWTWFSNSSYFGRRKIRIRHTPGRPDRVQFFFGSWRREEKKVNRTTHVLFLPPPLPSDPLPFPASSPKLSIRLNVRSRFGFMIWNRLEEKELKHPTKHFYIFETPNQFIDVSEVKINSWIDRTSRRQFSLLPDGPFYSFRAWQSGDQRILYSSGT